LGEINKSGDSPDHRPFIIKAGKPFRGKEFKIYIKITGGNLHSFFWRFLFLQLVFSALIVSVYFLESRFSGEDEHMTLSL